MKKKSLIYAIISIALMACNKNEIEEPDIEANIAEKDYNASIMPDVHKVNNFELENVIGNFCGEHMSMSRSSKYTITSIADENNNTVMYIVNFSDNEGFILISAVKDYYPILAYNTEGNFAVNSDKRSSALNEWTENTVAFLSNANTLPIDSINKYHKIWEKYEYKGLPKQKNFISRSSDNRYEEMQRIMQDSISIWLSRNWIVNDLLTGDEQKDAEMWNNGKSAIWPEYEDEWERWTVSLRSESTKTERIGGPLKTKWNQTYPYNVAYPKLSNGNNAYAGCVIVAMGQIMCYHQYPQKFNWDIMLSEFQGKFAAISSFMYELAEKTQSDYQLSKTTTSLSSMTYVMKNEYNYNADYGIVDFNIIDKNLSENHPVHISSHFYGANGTDYHSWVISGYAYTLYTTKAAIWTFTDPLRFKECVADQWSSGVVYYDVNWGYGGYGDGLYMMSQAFPPNNGYTSVRHEEMIYNIYPNNN